jgi:predicted branched-subunit amino acid permease
VKVDTHAFRHGLKTALPFWLPAAPVAFAYVAAAREAGFSALDIQWMSLTVYSASAQIAAVQLAGAPIVTILVTAGVVNLHFILYGLSLARRIPLSWGERAASAYVLTDAAYGIAIAAGEKATSAFLFGAGVSLFLAWNVMTALGLLLGLVIPASAQLEFAAPLTFFVLLVLTARTRLDYTVIRDFSRRDDGVSVGAAWQRDHTARRCSGGAGRRVDTNQKASPAIGRKIMPILLIAALVYLCRLSGFTLQSVNTSPFWEHFLRFVPISVFTALVVSSLYRDTSVLSVRVFALAITGLVAWRTRHLNWSILAGLATLWLIGALR